MIKQYPTLEAVNQRVLWKQCNSYFSYGKKYTNQNFQIILQYIKSLSKFGVICHLEMEILRLCSPT